jgi:hypothetical protein
MPEINILEKSIDLQALENSILSIQVSLDGFSFCIYDPDKRVFIGFRNYKIDDVNQVDRLVDKMEEIFKKDDLLKIPFRETRFIYLSQKSTLIPSAYFDKTKLKTYFEFNHTINELDEIHYNYISSADAYNVFAMPTYVASTAKLPNIKFYHQSTPLINSILSNFSGNKERVFINMNRSFFDIAVAGPKGLALYNSFAYQQESDLLYFILYVYNQLGLSPQHAELILSGENADNSRYYNALKSYITFVKYNSPDKNPEFISEFDKLNKYCYLNLFNVMNCG